MNGESGRMPLPRWEIDGNTLCLRTPDGSLAVPSADEIYGAAVEGVASILLPLPIVADGTPISVSRYPLEVELRIEAEEGRGSDGMRLAAYATGQGELIPLSDAARRKADHVVASGCWYPLVPGELDEVRFILGELSTDDLGPLSLRQYLRLLQLAPAHPQIRDASGHAASAERQKADKEGQQNPAGFAGTLYPYQRDGWRWLDLIASQDVGGILADEMGLGKTVQVAALLVSAKTRERGPSLIVATGTLLENWRRELAKFAPGLDVLIHRGGDRTGLPSELQLPDIVVTSYDTLIRDLSLIRQIAWNIVVLDEAQAIKNPDTRRASAVKRIPRRVAIAVTGTPVENRLSDLWSIADFALPGFLGDRGTFERTFANDEHGAEALEPFVSPILLRRRVADVAQDLPERIDIPQALELSEEQANKYEALRQDIIGQYGQAATLVALTRLRMFCTHPRLVGHGDGDPAAESEKYQRLTEILEEIFANGEKAIVFTSYNEMADLLVEDLGRRHAVPVTSVDGRTPIDERQNVIDRFSAVDGGAVLVLNPRAAGTGLNITAANHVIHYNLEWNPAVEDQASARAYRRGQTRPVTVHRLFYINTVEEIIDDRLSVKRTLAGKAVIGTDGADDTVQDIARALAQSPIRRTA